jgi:hypothetical protein
MKETLDGNIELGPGRRETISEPVVQTDQREAFFATRWKTSEEQTISLCEIEVTDHGGQTLERQWRF